MNELTSAQRAILSSIVGLANELRVMEAVTCPQRVGDGASIFTPIMLRERLKSFREQVCGLEAGIEAFYPSSEPKAPTS